MKRGAHPVVVPAVIAAALGSLFVGAITLTSFGLGRWAGLAICMGTVALMGCVIAWPVVTSASGQRRMDRLHAGHCMDCGYDLRENRGNCPECGKEIPEYLHRAVGSRRIEAVLPEDPPVGSDLKSLSPTQPAPASRTGE